MTASHLLDINIFLRQEEIANKISRAGSILNRRVRQRGYEISIVSLKKKKKITKINRDIPWRESNKLTKE